MAGLVIDTAQRIPETGEIFDVSGYAIEVLDREHTRLTKLKAQKAVGK